MCAQKRVKIRGEDFLAAEPSTVEVGDIAGTVAGNMRAIIELYDDLLSNNDDELKHRIIRAAS